MMAKGFDCLADKNLNLYVGKIVPAYPITKPLFLFFLNLSV